MRKKVEKLLSNFFGYSTKRKIVVIESDDWGSIRMPSLTAYNTLRDKGVDLDKGDGKRYNTLDTLARPKDFETLFDVLVSVKDANGSHAKFTPVSIMANPDFDKIKDSGFKEYHFEPFTNTLKRYGIHESFEYWKKGIAEKVFVPEFHGREHLNVASWMRALQAGHKSTHFAFNEGLWGFKDSSLPVSYQSAFDLEFFDDIKYQEEVIKSGLQLFEELFGYKASFFVPPNGPFNNNLEVTAFECGIKYQSVSKIQQEVFGGGQTKQQFHYIGQRSKRGPLYLTRNCFFEPSFTGNGFSAEDCLGHIETAFKFRKPAIISSHRVNYIGAHSVSNGDLGAKELKRLLETIIRKWPDVEFLTTPELGSLIENDKK